MFHIVIENYDGYIASYNTLKEAINGAQRLADIYLNDFHKEIIVHVVDTWDHIVW